MCFEFDYFLLTEGGAAANGTAGSFGFGSCHLESGSGHKQAIRLKFGRGVTNAANDAVFRNEVEYRFLIAALKDLVGCVQRASRSPSAYSLLVHTDAQLMVGQLTQGWQVKAGNLSTSLRAGLHLLADEPPRLVKASGRCDPSPSQDRPGQGVPRRDRGGARPLKIRSVLVREQGSPFFP